MDDFLPLDPKEREKVTLKTIANGITTAWTFSLPPSEDDNEQDATGQILENMDALLDTPKENDLKKITSTSAFKAIVPNTLPKETDTRDILERMDELLADVPEETIKHIDDAIYTLGEAENYTPHKSESDKLLGQIGQFVDTTNKTDAIRTLIEAAGEISAPSAVSSGELHAIIQMVEGNNMQDEEAAHPISVVSYNQDGQKHGPVEYYFTRNGQLQEKGTFQNDQRHGRFIRYDTSGQLREDVSYANGVPHGAFIRYDANGDLMHEGSYEHGEKQGRWYFPQREDENRHYVWFENGAEVATAASEQELDALLIEEAVPSYNGMSPGF